MAVGRGDSKPAMALLRGVGILGADQPGSEDAQCVAKEVELGT